MEKLTYSQMLDEFYKWNSEHNITRQFDDNALQGVIVFAESNWEDVYPLEARSYKVSSANKRFLPNMIGGSVFASSLDGTDPWVRLDYYPEWKVEYCYILGKENT